MILIKDGTKNLTSYAYGQYDYISVCSKPNYSETYSYEKLNDNCLKISITKIYNGTTSYLTKTLNEFGKIVEYTFPGTVLSFAYENGQLIYEKENDDLYTYEYDEYGRVKQVSLPSGEILSYSENYTDEDQNAITSELSLNN